MGHINIQIRQNLTVKGYILSIAEYLHEAWLAEVHDNGNTQIIRQFQYQKLSNCFEDLHQFVSRLGEVKKVSYNGVSPEDQAVLNTLLFSKSDGILPVNEPGKEATAQFWNWLQNDLYMTL